MVALQKKHETWIDIQARVMQALKSSVNRN